MKKVDKDNKDDYTDDVRFEPEEEIEMEESLQGKVKALREKLKASESESAEHLAGWQRAKADLINVRREAEEARERQATVATLRLMEDLLSVLDSFKMARGNKEHWESAPENWRKGVEQVENQLQKILEAHGLEVLKAEGEPFNPELHEATGTEPVSDESEDHIVKKVLQDGYQMGDRVIRPARVIIGVYSKE